MPPKTIQFLAVSGSLNGRKYRGGKQAKFSIGNSRSYMHIGATQGGISGSVFHKLQPAPGHRNP